MLGTLDADGIYTPTLDGMGSGGTIGAVRPSASRRSRGQYRIDKLPRPACCSTAEQFAQTLPAARPLLLRPRRALPGPRPALQPAERPGAARRLAARASSSPGRGRNCRTRSAPTPAGAGRRAARSRSSSASADQDRDPGQRRSSTPTVARPAGGPDRPDAGSSARRATAITITDGGKPVHIPRVGSDQFIAGRLRASHRPGPRRRRAVLPATAAGVVDEDGKPLAGPRRQRHYAPELGRARAAPAGPRTRCRRRRHGVGGRHRALDVGTPAAGCAPTCGRSRGARPGRRGRPGRAEVWIGDGPHAVPGHASAAWRRATRCRSRRRPAAAPIMALRLSPDGSRVALVVVGRDGGSPQLYVGRDRAQRAGQVRVDRPDPISPAGVAITDVAWIDSLKLFAIGYSASTATPKRLRDQRRRLASGRDRGIGNLPDGAGQRHRHRPSATWPGCRPTARVEAERQHWVSPSPTGTARRRARKPVYLE